MTPLRPLIQATATGVSIGLRVIPRAPRNTLAGVRDGRLVVRVTAPPVDQAANDAVVTLIAEVFDVPKRAIRIVHGSTGRNKTVEIEGVGPDAAARRLDAAQA